MIKRLFFGALALSAALTVSADEGRLLRFPNIHESHENADIRNISIIKEYLIVFFFIVI